MHGSKLENVALSGRVRELERTISVGTSQHRDVSKGIDRLHEALLSLGDSITTNIGIVNNNTKCINDALHVVSEDTSDIRRVVHDMSATHLAHPIPPVDLAPPASSTVPSGGGSNQPPSPTPRGGGGAKQQHGGRGKGARGQGG